MEFSNKYLTRNCLGLEPSSDSYKIAIKNEYNVINKGIENYNTNEQFDLISFWASLEYCINIDLVIKQIKKLLKKVGFY